MNREIKLYLSLIGYELQVINILHYYLSLNFYPLIFFSTEFEVPYAVGWGWREWPKLVVMRDLQSIDPRVFSSLSFSYIFFLLSPLIITTFRKEKFVYINLFIGMFGCVERKWKERKLRKSMDEFRLTLNPSSSIGFRNFLSIHFLSFKPNKA
jgi:hypothetical protein